MARKRVAIVGSGCSGLGALWALDQSGGFDIHLYEADDGIGGHTNTVDFKTGTSGKIIDVDTGFIVFNSATYPNFINFLKHLQVESVPTLMTFGVSRDGGVFEWAGTSLGGVFAQWSNVFSPRFWRMIFDIVRFNVFALDLLHYEDESENDPAWEEANGHADASKRPSQMSIGDYLETENYSDAFTNDYLLPMTAAVWSTSPEKCALDFPAITLVRFMWNHHLLSTISERPTWMTIPGGSGQYIEAVLKDFPDENIHLSCPVTGIEDINGKVILQFKDADEELFDHVILACHGDQAFEIVRAGGTVDERDVLSGFKTSENVAYLHSDLSLMPKRRATWSAWNLLTKTPAEAPADAEPDAVCLTYNMNILQHIPVDECGDVLVTLNPVTEPDPATVQGRWVYNHPLYDARMIQSQKRLARIQNTRGISYAGAWTKYGFHEDGLSSGLAVAVEHLGAALPFEFVDSTFSRGRRPVLTLGDYAARLAVWYIQVLIVLGSLWVRIATWPLRVVGLVAGRAGSRSSTTPGSKPGAHKQYSKLQ